VGGDAYPILYPTMHAHVPFRHLYTVVRLFGLLQYTSAILICAGYSSSISSRHVSMGVRAYVLVYPTTRTHAPVYHVYVVVRPMWLL
jgi:hypothetical protein